MIITWIIGAICFITGALIGYLISENEQLKKK